MTSSRAPPANRTPALAPEYGTCQTANFQHIARASRATSSTSTSGSIRVPPAATGNRSWSTTTKASRPCRSSRSSITRTAGSLVLPGVAALQLGLDERAALDLRARAVPGHDHARRRDLGVDDLQAAGGGAGLEEPLARAEDERQRPDVELVDRPVGVQRLDEVGAAL